MKRKCNLSMQDLKDKKINMHTHTTRCGHAWGEDREYVEKAIEAGFDVLGFSDHTPHIFEDDYVSPIRMKMEELEEYVQSVERLKQEYKNEIEIYCGLEVEYLPKRFHQTMEVIDQYPLDYMILGQHYFDDEVGWIHVKLDWKEEKDLKLYVDRVIEALETERFLYVAHPDIIKFTGSPEVYRRQMRRLAAELKKRNMPIEVNENGMRDGVHYPNPEFVKIGVEQGNDFIIGIDAHAPELLLDFEIYEKCKQLVLENGGRVINCL